MPIYDFKCSVCGKVLETFAKIGEREGTCFCGGQTRRMISAPSFKPPMQPYTSPVTGKWIEGERMRANDLASSNSIPYDPEMKKDLVRHSKAEDAKLDKMAERIVEDTWSQVNH